jgi:alkylation response protein AidB-like acyl-CoA dehydrogenase
LRSARNFVESNAQQVWQTVASSGELAFPQRIDIRMAATFALQEAKLVADVTWEIAGVNAIFSSGLFERRLRDIRTLMQLCSGPQSSRLPIGPGAEPGICLRRAANVQCPHALIA